MKPLVSIICVSFNHERFVHQALESVKCQSYSNIEIIIVDDGSSDNSKAVIQDWIERNTIKEFINLESNIGYCSAFNKAWSIAEGDFIIDFACDDVMIPDKIERQLNHFQLMDESYGITFTDAVYVDDEGKFIRDHFEYLFKKKLIKRIPQGDVYRDVLTTYYIPSPAMMIRRKVLELLDGYDEALAYEDFDLWVRASRGFKFGFLDERLMQIRRSGNSLSSGWYKKGDKQLHSTYLVCRKAMDLNRDEEDWRAWTARVRYELRQSVFSENIEEAKLFYDLLKETNRRELKDRIVFRLSSFNLPWSNIRQLYHRLRFG